MRLSGALPQMHTCKHASGESIVTFIFHVIRTRATRVQTNIPSIFYRSRARAQQQQQRVRGIWYLEWKNTHAQHPFPKTRRDDHRGGLLLHLTCLWVECALFVSHQTHPPTLQYIYSMYTYTYTFKQHDIMVSTCTCHTTHAHATAATAHSVGLWVCVKCALACAHALQTHHPHARTKQIQALLLPHPVPHSSQYPPTNHPFLDHFRAR